MEIIRTLRTAHRTLNHWALPFGAAGLAFVSWHNWQQWRRDKEAFANRSQNAPSPTVEAWPTQPKVSVLVAAWNEAAHIERHIQSFLALSYSHKELILCAGGEDGTYALARPYAKDNEIVMEQQSGAGKQRAVRRCFAQASGNIIFLTDCDCVRDDESFVYPIEPIAQGHFEAVTGRSQPLNEQRRNPLVQYQWYIDLEWSRHLPKVVDGVLGRNCALSRTALERIGAFNAPAETGTDYVMSRRLTQQDIAICAETRSVVATEYPSDARSYLRMWRRWNKNLLIHGLRFWAWNDVRGVAIAAVLYSGMTLLIVLAPLVGPIALVTSLLLFATAGLNRLRKVASGASIAYAGLTPQLVAQVFVSTALDMLAVLLAVRDALHPTHRTRW